MQVLSNDFVCAPVALIVFNRPDMTRKVINALREARVNKLFVIADGPRKSIPSDIEQCRLTRLVIEEIDWDCDVFLRYLDENIGCGYSPAKGLDWVFSQVEECIILEDDCIPNPTFFPFCTELLEKYKNDDRVMMISGNNHLLDKVTPKDSYLFSINTQTHGWATWKRAWSKYDFYISDWPEVRSQLWLENLLQNRRYAASWIQTFDEVYLETRKNDSCSYWDFQWTYCCWKNSALNILPKVNLITNIGYGERATHYIPADHLLAALPSQSVEFPLKHPHCMVRNYEADIAIREIVYGFKPRYIRALRKAKRLITTFLMSMRLKSKC